MSCLFCGFPENRYRPDAENKFICSKCVQLLLSADQVELKRAYSKAIEKGYSNKARAIKSFLILEGKVNGQRKPFTKKCRRHTHRKRINRTVGDKEKRIGRSQVPAQAPLL